MNIMTRQQQQTQAPEQHNRPGYKMLCGLAHPLKGCGTSGIISRLFNTLSAKWVFPNLDKIIAFTDWFTSERRHIYLYSTYEKIII